MNISEIQLQKATDYILKYYLKYGNYPEWKTVSYHLYEWLQENKPGVPLFSYTEATYKDAINIDVIKKYFNEIKEDVEVLYQAQENILKESIMMSVKRNLENKKEKNKQNKMYEEYLIEKEILEKEEEWKEFIHESFYDLENIKSEKSDVYFDLKSNCCTLENKKNKMKWINNKIKSVLVTKKNGVEIIQSPEKMIQKGEINYFLFEASETGSFCEVEIEFEKKESLNRIFINPYGYKEIEITITYENENQEKNYITTEKMTKKELSIIFETVETKKIQIQIKTNKKNLETSFNNYYGIKEIDFYYVDYKNEGTLYLKNIKKNNGIKGIMLKADDEIKDNTSIDYEIAIVEKDKNEEDLSWIKLKKEKKTILEKIKAEHINLNLISIPEQKSNGRVVFYLDKKVDTVNKEGYLVKGVNQWKVESCYLDFEAKIPEENNFEYTVKKSEKKVSIDYFDKGSYLLTKKNLNHNHYKYTSCFYSDVKEKIQIKIEFANKKNGVNEKINFKNYLFSCEFNSKTIKSKSNSIIVDVEKGWNEIKLFIHFGSVENKDVIELNSMPDRIFLNGIDLKQYKLCRAEKEKMKKLSEEDLIYRVSANTDNVYGMENDSIFLLKHQKNCRFQYIYKKESIAVEEIIFRAVLKKEEDFTDKTPLINSLTLYLE